MQQQSESYSSSQITAAYSIVDVTLLQDLLAEELRVNRNVAFNSSVDRLVAGQACAALAVDWEKALADIDDSLFAKRILIVAKRKHFLGMAVYRFEQAITEAQVLDIEVCRAYLHYHCNYLGLLYHLQHASTIVANKNALERVILHINRSFTSKQIADLLGEALAGIQHMETLESVSMDYFYYIHINLFENLQQLKAAYANNTSSRAAKADYKQALDEFVAWNALALRETSKATDHEFIELLRKYEIELPTAYQELAEMSVDEFLPTFARHKQTNSSGDYLMPLTPPAPMLTYRGKNPQLQA